MYETEKGLRSFRITAGVLQGTILGPTLWNGMCKGVLTMKLPRGVEIVRFADDILLTVSGGNASNRSHRHHH